MKKIIIIIFIIALLGELVWGINYLFSKNTTQKTDKQGAKADMEEIINVPNFSLTPKIGIYNMGSVFSVNLKIDSLNQGLSGADAILTYDKQLLEFVEIIPGKIFPFYPLRKNNIDKGEVSITGTLTDPSQSLFTGKGTFATVKFRVLNVGETKIKFDFTPGSTADSNLVEKKTGKDILETVINGSYTLIK